MIFWFFPLPLRPNFLQFWLKPILVFPPCFMSLDIFQCLPVYSRCELQFVSYCCEKTVYISFILEKKILFSGRSVFGPPLPLLLVSTSLPLLALAYLHPAPTRALGLCTPQVCRRQLAGARLAGSARGQAAGPLPVPPCRHL